MNPFALLLLQVVLALVVAIVWSRSLAHNDYMLGAMLFFAPAALFLLSRFDVMVFVTIATFASGLRVPGIGGKVVLHQVFITIMVGFLFLRIASHKASLSMRAASWKWGVMFGVVVLITIIVRGTGFRLLGDSKWGGMRYAGILASLLFFLAANALRLPAKRLRQAILATCLLAMLPFFAHTVFVLSGGTLYHQFALIQPVRLDALTLAESTGLTRLSGANLSSEFFLLVPFLLASFRRSRWTYITCITIAALLSVVSGHRLTTIVNLTFIILYGYTTTSSRRPGYFLLLAYAMATLVTITILFGRYMPFSFQRALSWVPFMDISPEAHASARATLLWRIGVWQQALAEVPTYLWVGKGYTYDPGLLDSLRRFGHYTERWAGIQVAYHNGPFSLLIGLGLPGLITGVGFMAAFLVRHYRRMKETWHDASLQRMHSVLTVWSAVLVMIFLTLYGDVYVSFPRLFFLAGLLEIISVSDHPDEEPHERRI